MYGISAACAQNRNRLQNYLKDNQIGSLIHYPVAPHKQEAYSELNGFHYPITEQIHDTVLSIHQ